MTTAQTAEPRVRLFIALDLPRDLREGIASWGTRELADPALRSVGPAALHITMAFLGHRPEEEIETFAAAVRLAGRTLAFPIELRDPVPRPARGRPRLFALPATSPHLIDLQEYLVDRLVSAGVYEPETRPFWPHVTVARARSEGRGSRRSAVVERRPGALPVALRKPFDDVRMTLYRSELQPRGARYVPLAQVELPGGGWQ